MDFKELLFHANNANSPLFNQSVSQLLKMKEQNPILFIQSLLTEISNETTNENIFFLAFVLIYKTHKSIYKCAQKQKLQIPIEIEFQILHCSFLKLSSLNEPIRNIAADLFSHVLSCAMQIGYNASEWISKIMSLLTDPPSPILFLTAADCVFSLPRQIPFPFENAFQQITSFIQNSKDADLVSRSIVLFSKHPENFLHSFQSPDEIAQFLIFLCSLLENPAFQMSCYAFFSNSISLILPFVNIFFEPLFNSSLRDLGSGTNRDMVIMIFQIWTEFFEYQESRCFSPFCGNILPFIFNIMSQPPNDLPCNTEYEPCTAAYYCLASIYQACPLFNDVAAFVIQNTENPNPGVREAVFKTMRILLLYSHDQFMEIPNLNSILIQHLHDEFLRVRFSVIDVLLIETPSAEFISHLFELMMDSEVNSIPALEVVRHIAMRQDFTEFPKLAQLLISTIPQAPLNVMPSLIGIFKFAMRSEIDSDFVFSVFSFLFSLLSQSGNLVHHFSLMNQLSEVFFILLQKSDNRILQFAEQFAEIMLAIYRKNTIYVALSNIILIGRISPEFLTSKIIPLLELIEEAIINHTDEGLVDLPNIIPQLFRFVDISSYADKLFVALLNAFVQTNNPSLRGSILTCFAQIASLTPQYIKPSVREMLFNMSLQISKGLDFLYSKIMDLSYPIIESLELLIIELAKTGDDLRIQESARNILGFVQVRDSMPFSIEQSIDTLRVIAKL